MSIATFVRPIPATLKTVDFSTRVTIDRQVLILAVCLKPNPPVVHTAPAYLCVDEDGVSRFHGIGTVTIDPEHLKYQYQRA